MSIPSSLVRNAPRHVSKLPSSSSLSSSSRIAPSFLSNRASRSLATVGSGQRALPDVWFTGSAPRRDFLAPNPESSPRKPDERTVKLGKSKHALLLHYNLHVLDIWLTKYLALRILQERLPTLLESPLPQELLSPQITLHLFPSTHPHLPTISGRVAYSAALWTSPIAWGRVPLVGNVKLEILSERMVKSPSHSNAPLPSGVTRPEQLIVRWRTIGKTRGKGTGAFYKGIGGSESVDKITEWLGGGKGEDDSKEFTGLFIFEFDEEGRVLSHTIEHVQEGGNWEKGMGARVVGLTDWLLGSLRKNGRGDEGAPCPAFWVDYDHINSDRSRR